MRHAEPHRGNAVVITASTRAAAGVYEDRTGPMIVERLRAWGFATGEPVVVPDGEPTGAAMREALAACPAVLVTTGGTGVRPDDRTPEVTAPLLDVQIPGIPEAFRRQGTKTGVPTAVLSRGLVGVAGRTLVVNLPGSRGGVQDGLDVLEGIIHHVVDQITGGGDH